MTDVIDLALKYGGFTSLDKVYLTTILSQLTPEKQQLLVTPPPSVVNAYFSELYQKQGPKAATNYYFELAKAFGWLTSQPSFTHEQHPFVRLNLSGQSFGFVYETDNETAQVFSEQPISATGGLLMELAQIFPHYKVYREGDEIKMRPLIFDEEGKKELDLLASDALLTSAFRLKGGIIKVSGYNAQEVLDVADNLVSGIDKAMLYYGFQQRECTIYIQE
ncbi:cystathionine beta-lyase [Streptococcus dentasini]